MEIKRRGLVAGASLPKGQVGLSQDWPLLLAPPAPIPQQEEASHSPWQQTQGASFALYDGKVGGGDQEVPAGVRALFCGSVSHGPC